MSMRGFGWPGGFVELLSTRGTGGLTLDMSLLLVGCAGDIQIISLAGC